MAIDIVLQRRGGFYVPFSPDDMTMGLVYPENMPLRAQISGAKKMRAYRELCAYKGSLRYLSSLALNENMDTEEKVDIMTKVRLGFVKSTIVINGNVQWIVKSLSYAECDHPEAHEFISKALEMHAELAGLDSVEDYLRLLNEQ